jgi:hypothetical protein
MLTCFFTFNVRLAASWRLGANVPASTYRRCPFISISPAIVDGGASSASDWKEAPVRIISERLLVFMLGGLGGHPEDRRRRLTSLPLGDPPWCRLQVDAGAEGDAVLEQAAHLIPGVRPGKRGEAGLRT